ncbi:hypothetical protein [Halobacillus halophilus]|uniref:hypothetical protein n=1 Tax=Halobacillus halophilus TaxID=1570 RepID=UPI001CD19EBB|nr:hypothetical protein [Halobacillus halophilus]MCA1012805.1 hypothetical protein [Halobacillus halophilus]
MNRRFSRCMDIADFSYQLKNVLWSEEALSLIPDFGWNDGGCRSLMKAFMIWFGSDSLRTYQIVKEPDQFHSEHAFVRLGDWFLDGDGVSGLLEMKHRWLYEEGFSAVIIREFDPETEPNHSNGEEPHYIHPALIRKLVQILDKHFHHQEVYALLQSPLQPTIQIKKEPSHETEF